MAEPRIADDYSFIAQRLRDIEAEKMPQPEPTPQYAFVCERCMDVGYIPSPQTSNGWVRCLERCAASYDKPRPPAVRR